MGTWNSHHWRFGWIPYRVFLRTARNLLIQNGFDLFWLHRNLQGAFSVSLWCMKFPCHASAGCTWCSTADTSSCKKPVDARFAQEPAWDRGIGYGFTFMPEENVNLLETSKNILKRQQLQWLYHCITRKWELEDEILFSGSLLCLCQC